MRAERVCVRAQAAVLVVSPFLTPPLSLSLSHVASPRPCAPLIATSSLPGRHRDYSTKVEDINAAVWPPSNHANAINEIQTWFLTKTRLGVPVDFSNEGIRGLAHYKTTNFPIQLALGATWDRTLVHTVGQVRASDKGTPFPVKWNTAGHPLISPTLPAHPRPPSLTLAHTHTHTRTHTSPQVTGREARALGYTNVYSPVVDLARDPRWGRVMDCYGEVRVFSTYSPTRPLSRPLSKPLSKPRDGLLRRGASRVVVVPPYTHCISSSRPPRVHTHTHDGRTYVHRLPSPSSRPPTSSADLSGRTRSWWASWPPPWRKACGPKTWPPPRSTGRSTASPRVAATGTRARTRTWRGGSWRRCTCCRGGSSSRRGPSRCVCPLSI